MEREVEIPEKQRAVQLVGPDQLVLNPSKDVTRPGRSQILARVEVVGLCFSDLKLLKQFSSHVRKSEVVSGIEAEVLREIPSYVPGENPTVPGHETVVRIVEVGPGVVGVKPGERYLVQTDYRWLRTSNSNAAFGYNFEGALQEYVLMDQRVITSPEGESMLLAASDRLSGSAIALVEPWACVEDAYASVERTGIKESGRMLIVGAGAAHVTAIMRLFSKYGKCRQATWVSQYKPPEGVDTLVVADVALTADEAFDDVLYFGSDAAVVETLFTKVAAGGLLNVALSGGRLGRDIVTPVGRFHYGGIRLVGTAGADPNDSMKYIPQTGEIRPGDKINVVGAAGPMGLMHVMRDICQGIAGVSVFGGDIDETRLATLERIAAPAAQANGVTLRTYNSQTDKIAEEFNYTVVMVPAPALVAAAVRSSAKGGIINVFAGIPATVTDPVDLDRYIQQQLYMLGTSGSTLDDMRRMLAKVESGRLDTNVSVAAVSGLEGAAAGIRAVEDRSIAGKIVVYPACKGLGLVRLEEMPQKMPQVAACLKDGLWAVEAERKLLETYGRDSD